MWKHIRKQFVGNRNRFDSSSISLTLIKSVFQLFREWLIITKSTYALQKRNKLWINFILVQGTFCFWPFFRAVLIHFSVKIKSIHKTFQCRTWIRSIFSSFFMHHRVSDVWSMHIWCLNIIVYMCSCLQPIYPCIFQ